jgi:hypothetical protein
VEGGGRIPPRLGLRVRFEPRSEFGSVIEVPVRQTVFPVTLMEEETYDVFLPNLPEEFYISAVRVGGVNVLATGLAGAGASREPFEIVVDSRGGRITGLVMGPQGEVWSGAHLVLIPDPPAGRLQQYIETSADEYGRFLVHGIAPGRYTLIGWLDEPPCEFFDADAQDGCRAAGMAVTVDPSSAQDFIFNARGGR